MGFKWSEMFPPATSYNENAVPDMSGKVVFVTGGTAGIGKETVRVLAEHGAKVYLGARSEAKAQGVIEKIVKRGIKGEVLFHKMDFGSVKQAKESAEAFLAREPQLHVLVNNAGTVVPDKGQKTLDGYEIHWGTNVLGPWVFTETLLPLLKSTARSAPKDSVRIVTVSSNAHHASSPPEGIKFEDISLKGQEGALNMTCYGQSKLANAVQSNYWAEQLKGYGILAVSLHPGPIKTDIGKGGPLLARLIFSLVRQLLFMTPQQGALTQIYAASSHDLSVSEHSGAYFDPIARLSKTSRIELEDPKFVKRTVDLLNVQVTDSLRH